VAGEGTAGAGESAMALEAMADAADEAAEAQERLLAEITATVEVINAEAREEGNRQPHRRRCR